MTVNDSGTETAKHVVRGATQAAFMTLMEREVTQAATSSDADR